VFPIEERLVSLLRKGKVASVGKLPSEPRAHDLSAADWSGLTIGEQGGRLVAMPSEGAGGSTYAFVRVSRSDVLREFPAFPEDVPTETNQPSEAEIADTVRALIEEHGGFLDQKKGAAIVREKFPHLSRDRARSLIKARTQNTKRGPRGPREKSPV
jgi:hypothetical protein